MHSLVSQLEACYRQEGYHPVLTDLMDKMAIFMKVTSGHYNLSRPLEEEDLHIRYKRTAITDYLIALFETLQKEYQHCSKRLEQQSMHASKVLL